MAAAQQCLGAAFDRHRRHQSFAVGDKVVLDSKNMGLSHVGTTGQCKLAARFLGPYTVEAVLGPSHYRLTLPPGLRLFPEFHISLLKPYQHDENPSRVNHVHRVIVADGEEGLLVHSITGHRHRHGSQQYRERWMDSTVKPSWEPLDNLNQIRGLIHEYLASLSSMRTTARLQEGL
ncbi:hypothetical protein PC128_g3152 [Phytophthora cactorum]|nr:hypothetical protein PC128_g3152 [Phytophthora cactorum]